jgi:putative intracellular protease/amidase
VRIVPDTTVDEVTVDNTAALLLPGADTWDEPRQAPIVAKTAELLAGGAVVAAICGATGALGAAGLLDSRPHTSNAVEYLKMTGPDYAGESFYVSEVAHADGNLITANSAGALLYAKLLLGRLGVFADDTLEFWYEFNQTGEAKHFFALMETLPRQ